MQQEAKNLYDQLTILRFYEENFEMVKNEISEEVLEAKLEGRQADVFEQPIPVVEEVAPAKEETVVDSEASEPIAEEKAPATPIEEEKIVVAELIVEDDEEEEEDASEGNMRAKYLRNTEKNIERMISLVQDLDTVSRLESGETQLDIEKFDIVDVCREVMELQEMRAKERNIRLVLKENYTPIYVLGDVNSIRQVLTNLVV
ncbi:MAG: hypothetical protein LRY32_06010, partial [Flavobacterium sp.]|nr:hypothetical protein [Flavobacterium sp.]